MYKQVCSSYFGGFEIWVNPIFRLLETGAIFLR